MNEKDLNDDDGRPRSYWVLLVMIREVENWYSGNGCDESQFQRLPKILCPRDRPSRKQLGSCRGNDERRREQDHTCHDADG